MRLVPLVLLIACGAGPDGSETTRAETTSANESEMASQSETANASSMEAEDVEAVERVEDTPADLQTTSEHSAVNAVVFGSRVVIHEVGAEGQPLRLTARDVFDDRVLWSIERPREGFNGLVQRFDDEHLILSLGDRLERIAVSDGTVLDSHPYRGRGRFVWRDRGVCLLNESCSVDLLDCESARPLQTFHIGHSRRRPLHGQSAPRCFGGPTIIGRSGDVLILHVDNWETNLVANRSRMRTGASSWVGVHADSGDIVWHADHPEAQQHGIAGRFAWFADDSGITVVRASNGRVHRQIARRDIRFAFDLGREPASVQLLFADSVEVVDLDRGRVTERRAIPPGTLAVHSDAEYPQHLYMRTRSDQAQSFMWIAPGADPVVRPVPPGETLHRSAPGEPWAIGRSPTYDSAGNLIEPGVFEVERYRSGDAGPPDRARLKQGDRVILELDHDAWSLGEATRGQARAIVLFVKGEDWRTDSRVYIHRQ